MSRRVLLMVSAICLFVAALIAVIVYLAEPQPVLHDVAAVTRIPMPGEADVKLRPGSYGLYFGQLVAPTGKRMGIPSLSIKIMPPSGVDDPAFTDVAPRTDMYVDGYHTVQVALIEVTAAGIYKVDVKSPEQSGGSFSIGAPPETISGARNVLRAWPLIGLFLGLGALFLLWQVAQFARTRKALP